MVKHLYRIFDEDSRDYFDDFRGFEATSKKPFHLNTTGVPILKKHMDWGNRECTPFISTTDDVHRALKLAKQRLNFRGEQKRIHVQIAVVDQDKLGAWYRMMELVRRLDVLLPYKCKDETECLCLHRIPARAVATILTVDELDIVKDVLHRMDTSSWTLEDCEECVRRGAAHTGKRNYAHGSRGPTSDDVHYKPGPRTSLHPQGWWRKYHQDPDFHAACEEAADEEQDMCDSLEHMWDH